MKKIFLLFVMAMMTATVANAQTAIPSDGVLNRYRSVNANVLIGFYTEAPFCNDLVFAGTYNNWNVEVDSLVRFVPLDSFPNWYVCSFYDDGTFDYENGVCGKVVALRADGAFEWGCQWGSDVQLLRGNALLYEELPGEMMLRNIDTSAPVVLSSSLWKSGADPCAPKQTYTVYLDAPSCADAEGNTFLPAVIGDFTGWGELIPMTQLASGSSCMCTFEAYPGQTFRFVAMGEWVDWDNQLQYYSATEGAWVDAPIITLDTMSQLSYDYSEGRYGYCVNVPTPEPDPESVLPSYVEMPEYMYRYTTRDSVDLPICRIEGGTRNCSVEWGWVENYDPQYSASGAPMPNSDITKPTMVYHVLKVDTAYTVESDPTSTTYKPVLKLKSEFDLRQYPSVDINEDFYCRLYQNDSIIREQVFTYVSAMQVLDLWISVEELYEGVHDGDSVPSRAGLEVNGPGQGGEVRIEWYNAQDTAEVDPVDVFRNGNWYYAKVLTPFDSLFIPGYVLNERTNIYWGGAWFGDQGDVHYDNSGSFRSPVMQVDDVTWEIGIRMREGGYYIHSYANVNRDSLTVDTVRLEMATDVTDWMPLTGENIYIERNSISGFLPALAFRAGTYYFRCVAVAGGREYTSQVYTVVIGGGITIDTENVTEGAIEYDAETNTVTISDAVIENVVTALTNMQDGVTISLEGITTMTAEENGILTSADIVIKGSYDEVTYTSTDTMTISAPRPIIASAEGVKITFDGVTLHLVVPGHEGDVVPGLVAARRQMSPMMRARYIAKTVLLAQDASESVISGFDEADFINCGIIEPEGAEYDEDNLELMEGNDPVYNCTIVPMNMPTGLENVGLKEEKIGADKRVVGGMVLIIRQEKVYTVTGQLVK